MKQVLILLFALMLFALLTVAQAADEQKAAHPTQSMPMMMHGADGKNGMECPMVMKAGDDKMTNCSMMRSMNPMMDHHQLMKDLMQTMQSMLNIQKQMLGIPSAEEKTRMEQDLSAMIEKINKMMSSSQQMMMDMQKPAAGEHQKDSPMPMGHHN